MILDHDTLFSNKQMVTASVNAENILDLGPLFPNSQIRNIGAGEAMTLFLTVSADALPAAATVQIELITSSNSTLSSPETIFTSKAITVSDLMASPVQVKIPNAGYKRYLGAKYVITGGPLTSGSITAGLVLGAQDYNTYPSAS